MEKKKIVFLYSEIANYFLACVEELLKDSSLDVHLIRWKVNKEAPFDFEFKDGLKVYDRSAYTDKQLLELIKEINPRLIYVSGWLDKGYLKVCRHFRHRIPVIVGFDNRWNGSLKQRLVKLVSPFKIQNHFSHCWIPGKPQMEYAKKLGFKNVNILTGFYSCDFDFFHSQYSKNQDSKGEKFPKRFLYVGRYVEHKGIKDLWDAFIAMQDEFPTEWELWCLGTGDIQPVEHPRIRHYGFIQPGEMKAFISNTGVFVLPSHFEPWGVVVHEFTSAGFPVICSDEVGAATAFVENNLNGYIYKAGDTEALKNALLRVVLLQPDKLLAMGDHSVGLAEQITPEKWAQKLKSVL
jgi:glycosyltransferase involved in cell wall biosynthesis